MTVSKDWIKPLIDAKNIKRLILGQPLRREFYETLETPKDAKTMSKDEYELLRKFEYVELNNLTELTDEAYELFKTDNATLVMPNLNKITIKNFEKSPFAGLRKKDGGEIHFGNIHTIEIPIR